MLVMLGGPHDALSDSGDSSALMSPRGAGELFNCEVVGKIEGRLKPFTYTGSKKLLVAPGLTTRSKNSTRSKKLSYYVEAIATRNKKLLVANSLRRKDRCLGSRLRM